MFRNTSTDSTPPSTLRKLFSYLAIVLLVAVPLARVSFSATPVYATAAASISPTSGVIGTHVTVTGTGFTPNKTGVTVLWSGSVVYNSCSTDSSGALNSGCTFTVPFTTTGSHVVSVCDNWLYTYCDQAGHQVYIDPPFTVLVPTITLNPTSGPAGTSVAVSGTLFAPSSTVTVRWGSSTGTILNSSCSVNTSGTLNSGCTFTVPTGGSLTPHTVYAADNAADPDGNVGTATFTVTVQPQIILNPTSGPVGRSVAVSGTLFAPSSTVTVRWGSSTGTILNSSCSTNTSGTLNSGCTFTVPTDTAGSHDVYASDASGNWDTAAFTIVAGAATHLAVSAPGTATAGTAFNVAVTAKDANNNTDTGYTGTVHFTSGDTAAGLPADGTLTNGTGTFSVTLKTAGSQTVTATDTVTGSITGTSAAINVAAGSTTGFTVSAPSIAAVGTAFSFTVTAKDAYGNTATGYTGTVHFSSTDTAASLPGNTTLISGTKQLSATLNTQGSRTITATDTVNGSIAGTSGSISVNPPCNDPTATSITTMDQLQGIGGTTGPLSGKYCLANDLNASGYSFTPIGTSSPFTGTFDGQGHTISNLTINLPSTDAVGLFSQTAYGAVIKNVGLVNASVSGHNNTGALVGANSGSITKSYSTGTVSGGSDTIGGLVGYNYDGSISTSYSTASVTGIYHVGGLVGYNYSMLHTASITYSYSTGSVSGSTYYSAWIYGLLGYDYNGNISSNYWDKDTSGQSQSFGPAGGTTGLTDTEMRQQAKFVGWDFGTTWGIDDGATYPYFTWQSPVITAHSPTGIAVGVGSNVTVTFSEAMAAGSFTGSTFYLTPQGSGTHVPASLSPSGDGKTETLNPTGDLTGNTTYTVTVKGGSSGVTDSAGNTLPADGKWSFTTAAGAATHFAVSAPSNATAGTAFNVTVTALDANNNTAAGYSGSFTFSSSDSQAILPSGNQSLTNGTGTFSATLKTAGTRTITATDTANSSISGTSGNITVAAGAATHLTVSAPGTATAGTAFNVTVTAKDTNNNTDTGYTGTVQFSLGTADSGATGLGNYTFTGSNNGTHTFSVTLTKAAASQTITATDTVTGSITGSSGIIAVSSGTATHLSVTAPSSATAGTAFNVTVTALDASNNTVTGYTGTVHLTSSDGAAVLPANGTLTNGTRTFSVTLNTEGSQTVTATDTITGSITGTSGSVTVNPAPVAPSITTNPTDQTVTAGGSLTLSVVATGIPAPSYQWYHSDTGTAGTFSAISGATSSSYQVAQATAADAGYYYVHVSNSQGSTNSTTAHVTVNAPPISFVSRSSDGYESVTQFSVNRPGGTTTGDVLIAQVTIGSSGTESAGSQGWTYYGTVTGTYIKQQVFYKVVAADEPSSYQWNFTSQTRAIVAISAYRGVDTEQPIDVSSSNSGAGSTLTASGVTTTKPNDLVVALFGIGLSSTASANIYQIVTPGDMTQITYPVSLTFTKQIGPVTAAYAQKATAGATGTMQAESQTCVQTSCTWGPASGNWVTNTVALQPGPGPATHLSVSAPSSVTAGSAFSVTVTAKNATDNTVTGYTGTVHFTGGGTNATLPPDYSFVAADHGSHTFAGVSLTQAGSRTITATDAGNSSISGNATISVEVGTATKLAITSVNGGSNPAAGSPFNVVIQSQDAGGNAANVSQNTGVSLSVSTGTGTLGGTTTGTINSGSSTVTLSVTYPRAESGVVITSAATSGMSLTSGSSAPFTVNAGTATKLAITSVNNGNIPALGSAFSVKVQAEDANGDPATVTSNTSVSLTLKTGTGTLGGTTTGTITSGSNSVTISGVTYTKAESGVVITAAATSGMSLTSGDSAPFTVNTGAATTLLVSAPTTATAGTAISVSVTAKDAYGNIASLYSGTVHFTSSDGAAVLPANSTLTNGTGTFSVTLRTTGSQTITATDTVTGSITGTSGTVTASGCDAGFVAVTTEAQLQAIGSNLIGKYCLVGDLDAGGSAFTPIGDNVSRFTGTFDGQGHTISHLTISLGTTSYVGLFGYMGASGIVRNLGLEDVNVTGYADVGGLAGYNLGTITSSYSTGSVTGSYAFTGGLAGYNGGTITSSHSTATVPGAAGYSGGLVGDNAGTIQTSYSSGNVTGNGNDNGGLAGTNTGTISSSHSTGSAHGGSYIGGLVGDNTGTIQTSYSTGTVSGVTDIGGLVGYNYTNGSITSSYSTGTVTGSGNNTGGLVGLNGTTTTAAISSSYSTGSVSGGSNTGGLVGYNNGGTISSSYSTGHVSGSSVGGLVGWNWSGSITSSYWDMDTSGRTTSAVGTGLSDSAMRLPGSFGTWDFGSTWAISSGGTYPYLQWQAPVFAVTTTLSGTPPTTTAGSAFPVTVTALNAGGTTATGYTGTVHLVSSDGQAVLPADGSLTDGTGQFTVTLTTLGNQTVTATDISNATITGSSGIIAVSAGTATHFSVSAPSSATAGTAFNVTVTALDASNNTVTGYTGTVHFTSSDGAAVLPNNYQFVAGDNGSHIFTDGVTLKTLGTGSQTISVNDTVSTSITGTATVTVTEEPLDHFLVTAPTSATAGSVFSVTVTAKDAGGNTVTGFTGTVDLSPDVGSLSPAVSGSFTAGVWTGNVTLTKSGNRTVTATETNGTITGSSGIIAVGAGALDHFSVSAPANATTGTAFSTTITAQDTYDNTVTGYDAAVTLSDDSTTIAPTSCNSWSSGVCSVVVTVTQAGSDTIHVSDGTAPTAHTGDSGTFTVNAGTATKLQILVPGETAAPGTTGGKTGSPSAQTTGTAFNVTVNAVDDNWNVVSTANPTVHLTTTDSAATLPANAALSSGTHTFSVTLKTADSSGWTITASDTAGSGALTSSTSPSIPVDLGAATHYLVTSNTYSPVAGSDVTITAQLEDLGDNAVSTSGKIVTWGSTNGGYFASATSTTNSSGVATVTFTTSSVAGTQHVVTATDDSSPTHLTGNSLTITTTTGPADKLVFTTKAYDGGTGNNAALTAGTVSGIMSVQLRDANGNPVTVTGNVTVGLSSNSAGTATFYQQGSTTPITSATINTNSSSADFTYKDTKVGAPTITASAGVCGSGGATACTDASQVETVNPAGAASFTVSTPSDVTAGVPFSETVTAYDAFSNLATGYTGTPTLSDDSGTISPTATDAFVEGVWTGDVTVTQPGTDMITATDGSITGQSGSFSVANPLPTLLTIPGTPFTTDSSPNQGTFNLSWTKSSGGTGSITYHLQHSNNNGNTWSDVTGATTLPGPSYAFGSGGTAQEAQGTWVYRVQANAGLETSGWSDTSSPVIVDRTAPKAPAITSPANNSYSNTGNITVTGTAEAGSTVKLYEGTTQVGSPVIATGGTWSIILTSVPDGSHTYRATATDAAGNVSAYSATRTVIVNMTIPAAPVITSPVDGSLVTSVTLAGTAEPSSRVEIFDGGVSKGTVTASSAGTWSKALAGVTDGQHTYTATATDAAGNTSPVSAPVSVTVDATHPTITGRSPINGAVGVAPGTNITVTFSEAMNQSSVTAVTVYLTVAGTPTHLAAGFSWDGTSLTLDPADTLALSTKYSVTVVGGNNGVKDLAGNPLGANATWSFTTAAGPLGTPGQPVADNPISQGTFTLTWSPSSGGGGPITYTLQHSNNNGSTWSTVDSGLSSTSYAFTGTQEAEGKWIYQVQATDGTQTSAWSSHSSNVIIDRTDPAITLNTPADGGTYVLNAKVNAKFSCSDPLAGIQSCTALADGGTPVANGKPFPTSPIGPHTFTVTATDKAGNSVTTDPITYTVGYKIVYGYNTGAAFHTTDTITLSVQLLDANNVNKSTDPAVEGGIGLMAKDLSIGGVATSLCTPDCPEFEYTSSLGGRGTLAGPGYRLTLPTNPGVAGNYLLHFTAFQTQGDLSHSEYTAPVYQAPFLIR